MFSFFKRSPPIENVGNIDVIAKRKDGVLELLVVTSSKLDDSPETQKLLLDKIEPYLLFLQSDECRSEFGELDQSQKLVVIRCYEKPDPIMAEFFPRVTQWVQESGATLEVRYGH